MGTCRLAICYLLEGTLAFCHLIMILSITIRFIRDVFNNADSAVDELFFWQQTFEDDFAILQIITVKILSLYFFLVCDFYTVEHSKLWHVEQTLESVIFAVLNRVNTKVNFSKKRQVLDISELVDLLNVVETHVQELKAFDLFQPLQLDDLVLGQVQCPQGW